MTNTATLRQRFTPNATTVNDMTRRFGYSGGAMGMTIDPKSSGLPMNPIEGGQLLLYVPGIEVNHGMYNDFARAYSITKRSIPPTEYAYTVKKKFQDLEDYGYRNLTCLTQLPYEVSDTAYIDDAYAYFDVVHPAIVCPEGLERTQRSTTPGNLAAEWYQSCPTCRLKSLQSQEIQRAIDSSDLDRSILEELRDTLIDACQATVFFAQMKVELIEADLDRRSHGDNGRTTRNEADYVYLKMLHRKAPQKAEPITADQIAGAAASAATNAAMQFANPEFQEFLRWKAEQAKEQAVDELIENQMTPAQERMAKAREAKKNKDVSDV